MYIMPLSPPVSSLFCDQDLGRPASMLTRTPTVRDHRAAPEHPARTVAGVIRLTLAASFALHTATPQPLDHLGQAKQVFHPEATATGCDGPKWVGRRSARPAYGHVVQPAAVIEEVDAVLSPRVPVRDQLEVSAEEGMEGMGYANNRSRITRIGCSRLLSRRARSRQALATPRRHRSRDCASRASKRLRRTSTVGRSVGRTPASTAPPSVRCR